MTCTESTISATAASSTHSEGLAQASWDGQDLVLNTGLVERHWRWTGAGLTTIALHRLGGSERIRTVSPDCDWSLPGGLSMQDARLVSVVLDSDDDAGFVGRFLRARVHITYPSARCDLEFVVWALPGAPGFRTSFTIQGHADYCPPSSDATTDSLARRAEHLAIAMGPARAAGYATCTQQRNLPETPILRDDTIPADGSCDWASLCAIETDGEGCCLVKESHRCTNQPGHDGGAFTLGHSGLGSTGWGVLANEICATPRQSWAHWSLVYAATGSESLPQAVRDFIRLRYPRNARHDCYVMSNTWGSTDGSRDARDAAREENVLRELTIAADIGVDVVQIDDGWQVDLAAPNWIPQAEHGWLPHPAVYPQGWNRVRARAAELGLRLGLWAAGMPVTGAELRRNRDQGGFTHYKLDFMKLVDHQRIAEFRDKVRHFVSESGHAVRINFDVTELEPRVGYFWLREAGSLYLANRKPHLPESTIYRPWLVLRDAWHLSRFQRLQDVQITMQNPQRTNRVRSDAWQHSTPYCLAITLMASPILFQQLQFLDAAQRAEIRSLLSVYRQHRLAIHSGDVTAIGAEPDNASHTGFHCRCDARSGYILALREVDNGDPTWHAQIPVTGTLIWTDCVNGETDQVDLEDGRLNLVIPQAAGFRLLRYELA